MGCDAFASLPDGGSADPAVRRLQPHATGATSWRMRASKTADIAALMNELFVNIKVDREERPDVDTIYMHGCAGNDGHGGWPMTVFLTPDGVPFYGGTYFPPERSSGDCLHSRGCCEPR